MNYLKNANEKLSLNLINRIPDGDDTPTGGGGDVELPPNGDD
ncbi:hypothetical protein [Flexithrix dorotheae]|nr:hypothetical protein [Flexithrix dorotheae]